MRVLSGFLADESAQGLIEYALVIALVSLCAVAAMKIVGRKSSNTIKHAARFLK